MKAIVLETRDGMAAVLREDGEIVKVRRDGQVGETIELSAEVIPLFRRRWVQNTAAAVLALAVLGGSYTYTTVSACAYVSLDVGGSAVEVAVNRRGRVIVVSPITEESAALAEKLTDDMKNQKVDQAFDAAIAQLRRHGYLSDAENDYIIAGVTSDDSQRSESLSKAVENSVASMGEDGVQLYTLDVTREERGEAERRSMSGGRYVLRQRGINPMRAWLAAARARMVRDGTQEANGTLTEPADEARQDSDSAEIRTTPQKEPTGQQSDGTTRSLPRKGLQNGDGSGDERTPGAFPRSERAQQGGDEDGDTARRFPRVDRTQRDGDGETPRRFPRQGRSQRDGDEGGDTARRFPRVDRTQQDGDGDTPRRFPRKGRFERGGNEVEGESVSPPPSSEKQPTAVFQEQTAAPEEPLTPASEEQAASLPEEQPISVSEEQPKD